MLRLDEQGDTRQLTPTSLSNEDYREDDLREWILESAEDILDENILIIGREVPVKEISDAIDLLGIDPDGNLVIIELKRGALRGPVDFQGIKYAAYTAHWDYEELKEQFEQFKTSKWGKQLYEKRVSFTEKLDEFCNDDYSFNQEQRIMFVGESIKERLDLVIRWLSDRSIDVSVVEIDLLKEGDRLYIDTEQTIPIPENSPPDIRPDTSDKPWEGNGRNWHLNERSNDETAELLRETVTAIEDVESLEGPAWGQKLYIAFKQSRKNRVTIRTYQEHFHVRIFDIDPDEIDVDTLSNSIGVDTEEVTAAEKLSGTRRSGVQITCSGSDSIDTEALSDSIGELL